MMNQKFVRRSLFMKNEHIKKVVDEVANRDGHEDVDGSIEAVDHVIPDFGIGVEGP